jgi:MFS family permease
VRFGRGLSLAGNQPALSRNATAVVRSGAEGDARKNAIFSALRFRNYRLFWLGQLVSVTGTFMQGTAQQWLVLTLSHNNPMPLGIVGALQFGPMLIPFGGAIADRWPRRNVLMGTQAASGVLALVLWALTLLNIAQLWEVYALALLLGIVNAVDMPTRQAFVSEMVSKDYLLNAISLNSAQFNASRIVGPALAGAMIAIFSIPLLFLLNAISYIAVIAGLILMRPSELVPLPERTVQHGMARIRALGDGARFVLSRRTVLITFMIVAVVGTMGFNFNVLLPVEATNVLHAGSAIFGLLTSALGAGALIGALLLARRGGKPTNRMLVGTAGTFGLFEMAIAFSRSVPLTLLLIAFTGFATSMFSASANTRVQLSSPVELRGRVMAVYSMVFIGTTPIGSLIVSSVATAGGVPLAFIICGLPCFLIAAYAAWLWRDSLGAAPVRAGAPVLAQPNPVDTPPAALPATPQPPVRLAGQPALRRP